MNLTQADLDPSDMASAIEEALQMGAIDSVDSVRNDAFNSEVYFITVHYRNKSDTHAPEKLVFKRNKEHDGSFEFQFYSVVSKPATILEMVPTCYFAKYDQETGITALLLQDVSDTHQAAVDYALNIKGEAPCRTASLGQYPEGTGRISVLLVGIFKYWLFVRIISHAVGV